MRAGLRRKGFFITFEKTCDGLGGTTQVRLLYDSLIAAGYPALITREPGGTDIGTIARDILLKYKGEMSRATELFLFNADRAQHYKEILKPALKAGKVIVCDRYFDSTLAYQGGGRKWERQTLLKLHDVATGSLVPDLTFVLDGTPHAALDKSDRFERQTSEFFQRVKTTLLEVARGNPRYVVINANRPKDELAAEIYTIVTGRMCLPDK